MSNVKAFKIFNQLIILLFIKLFYHELLWLRGLIICFSIRDAIILIESRKLLLFSRRIWLLRVYILRSMNVNLLRSVLSETVHTWLVNLSSLLNRCEYWRLRESSSSLALNSGLAGTSIIIYHCLAVYERLLLVSYLLLNLLRISRAHYWLVLLNLVKWQHRVIGIIVEYLSLSIVMSSTI